VWLRQEETAMDLSRRDWVGEELATEVGSLQKLLFARALGLARSHEDARDLVQDTFERALARRDQFVPGSSVRAWLLHIMRNLFIDRWRRRMRERSEGEPYGDLAAPEPEAPPPAWEDLEGEQIVGALVALAPPFREVMELRLVARRSYREISVALGIPTATVGTRLRRARNKLRDVLETTALAS
jgi:RNA polymerase sigma-70 factor (ECF subfamily)